MTVSQVRAADAGSSVCLVINRLAAELRVTLEDPGDSGCLWSQTVELHWVRSSMASHSYSFSLKLHVIRNIITAPYSSPQNTIFLCSGSTLVGRGRGEGGTEHMFASAVGKAGEISEERSCQEVGWGMKPTLCGTRALWSSKKFRGPSERQKTSAKRFIEIVPA